MIRRLVLAATVTSAALLAVGAAASAHIDPDPVQAQAGSRLTVGFTVEHGCAGSPTVQLDMRLPEGVIDPVPEPVEGWDGSVDTVDGDTIVTFEGGPLADDVEGTFSVTMTLPPMPDTTIYFPFVQRCEVDEIRWIGIPAEPGDELDEPAPAMALTGPVATVPSPAPETVPPDTVPATTEPATAESTIAPTTEPSPGTSAPPGTSEPVLIAAAGDDTGNTGTIVFIVSIAAIVGLGGFVVFRSRQARAGTAPDAS
jgi:periplasmic copper chaperone A